MLSGESSMDMLVEIVSLLGPPCLTDLKQMNVILGEDHEDIDGNVDGDDSNVTSLIELVLSIRTFKTYQERLREKLEVTFSGRANVSSEIVNLILNSLQYLPNDRVSILHPFQPASPFEE